MEADQTAGPLEGANSPSSQFRSFGGRTIRFDPEGFFWDFDDWNEQFAELLAGESGLASLTSTHWQVIRFLRDYYFNYRRAPLNRQLKEGTGLSLRELEDLFPGGIKYGARRLAGLPDPQNCL